MLVLAAVPAAQFHKLRRAAAPRFPVVHAQDWDVALATIRTRPVELAAVDPTLQGSASAHEIERLRLLFPSLPLILYTVLSPATGAVLLALGQTGIRAVVFTRIDDHPARLREVLAHEEARSATLQLHARCYLGLAAGEMRLTLEPRQALERIAQGFVPPRQAQATAS